MIFSANLSKPILLGQVGSKDIKLTEIDSSRNKSAVSRVVCLIFEGNVLRALQETNVNSGR